MGRINLYNASGCADPTAQAALESVRKREVEIARCVRVIRKLLSEKNLELVNRIVIRDAENGRVYR